MVALTDALARAGGVAVQLLSQLDPNSSAAPSVGLVRRTLVAEQSWLGSKIGLSFRTNLARISASNRPDLVHSHGLWQPANHWASSFARDRQVPLVIHPRGMLEPWALAQKPVKKRMALAVFQRRDLMGAHAFVATSDMEWNNLRRFGVRQPVAVIANGVELALPNAGVRPPSRSGERIALFMSRVHPKKGLLQLVRAWAQAAPAGWRLQIAGPDEGGHWSQVEALVTRLGLRGCVNYLGAVEGERKAALFRNADLFVLPTFSENFGVVVAEALAYGVPVITTRGAPWGGSRHIAAAGGLI